MSACRPIALADPHAVATEAAPKAKKPRKSDDVSAPAKPAKATKPKPARKQAEDFFSDNEAPAAKPAKATKAKKAAKAAVEAVVETAADDEDMLDFDVIEAKQVTPKKTKGKKAKVVEEVAVEAAPAAVEAPAKKSKKAKSSKKQEEVPVEEVVEEVVEAVAEPEEVEEDDQTAALLAGFSDDDDESDSDNDIAFDEDAPVPALTKSQRKAIAKAAATPKSNEPGVIYVGYVPPPPFTLHPSLTLCSSRVPRGFFEPQMKKYFSQFGTVNKLRLSRNKKTGASKHYAFVEFASAEVADIVARTMDNYLMFGHILKCKLIPAEQVNPNLFKGANQRFKVDPRNKKAGLAMERGAERDVWEKRVANENKRRSGRNKALKADFDYEFTAPSLKAVGAVPEQSAAVEDAASQQLLDEAASAAVAEQPKAKKAKKAPATTVVKTAEVVEPMPEKKGKKVTKTVVVEETPAAALAPAPKKKTTTKKAAVVAEEKPAAAAAPKAKKAKKTKA